MPTALVTGTSTGIGAACVARLAGTGWTQAAMPLLRAAKGRVVHIGSIAGRLSLPGLSPYSASKHARSATSAVSATGG